MTISDVIRAGQ